MKDRQLESDQGTVLLRVDSHSISVITIDLAVAIAASAKTRLHGLFVENEDLLRAASLPFTREISFTTAKEQPTDFEQMQRSLQAMATQFKEALQKAAKASKIPCSFDYVSGRLPDLERGPDRECTYTIVAQRSSGLVSSAQSPRSIRRILLIEDHSPHLIHALSVVLKRFDRQRVEVTVVAAEGCDNGPELDLHSVVNSTESRISLVELKHDQLEELLRDHGGMFDCVILSSQESATSQKFILKQLQCPVILVS